MSNFDAPGTLTDIAWELPAPFLTSPVRIAKLLVIGIACVVLAAALAGGLSASGVPESVAWIGVGAVALGVLLLSRSLLDRRARTQIEMFFRQRWDLPAAPLIDKLFRAYPPGVNLPSHAIYCLFCWLAEREHWGASFRAGPPRRLGPIEPIMTSFESRPLDQADSAFEALRAAAAPPGAGAERIERSFQRRQIAGWSETLCGVMGLAGFLMLTVGRGQWDLFAMGVAVFLLSCAGGLLALVARWPGRAPRPAPRWLIAPGGVLWLTPRGQAWQVETVDRRDAMLLTYFKGVERSWDLLILSRSGRYEGRSVTQIELDLLLRAWLSPLRPPSAETLSDWT